VSNYVVVCPLMRYCAEYRFYLVCHVQFERFLCSWTIYMTVRFCLCPLFLFFPFCWFFKLPSDYTLFLFIHDALQIMLFFWNDEWLVTNVWFIFPSVYFLDLAATIVRSVIMSSSFIFYAPFFYISLDSLSL
jgi:hypothetical protein